MRLMFVCDPTSRVVTVGVCVKVVEVEVLVGVV